jgi:predicted Fe-Mo cluster-binding NifX family protein
VEQPSEKENFLDHSTILGGIMKIAIASENGKTISRHFGRASKYIVINTDGRNILDREIRPKIGHLHSDCIKHKDGSCECRNQNCEASVYDRHRTMIIDILDCSVLLTGGTGSGVLDMLISRGIKPIITDVEDIDKAVKLYLEGNLPELR